VHSLMHATQTDDDDAQLDAAHRMIRVAKPSMLRRWPESKRAIGNQHVQILKAKCTLHLSRVDSGSASNAQNPGGDIRFPGCLSSMEGSTMAASMIIICVRRHRGSE